MSDSKPKPKTTLAFDVYGTLLSTASISTNLVPHVGGKEEADFIATEWRRLQLESTWRLNSMGKYVPFTKVTELSLIHALALYGIKLPEDTIRELMTSYNGLQCFADVEPLFEQLASHKDDITAVLFSNGAPDALEASLKTSPSLSPHARLFERIVSVHEVRKFKPAPEVYNHLVEEMGGDRDRIWLVSSNAFDVVGARSVGLRTVWVGRGGEWVDGLGVGLEVDGGLGPDLVVGGVGEVVEGVLGFVEGRGE